MGINCRPARLAKTDQRQITTLCYFYRQRSRRRDGKEDFDAAHRRLLHHLIAGAAGDQHRAGGPCFTGARPVPEQLIQRHMATHIFMPARQLARRQQPRGGVRTAAQLPNWLYISLVRERIIQRG